MKFKPDDRYYTYAVYSAVTIWAIMAGTLILFRLPQFFRWFWQIVSSVYHLLKQLLWGILIAYLLDPIVIFYDKKWKNKKVQLFKVHGRSRNKQSIKKERWHMRTVPTLFTFLTGLMIFGLFILTIVMNVQTVMGSASFANLSVSFKAYISQFEEMMLSFSHHLFPGVGEKLVTRLYALLNGMLNSFANRFIISIADIGAGTMNFILALVMAFYLLQDKARALAFLNKLMHSIFRGSVYRHIEVLAKDIDYVFSGYIRGQIIDAVIVAVLTSLILTWIQLDFAIIIGLLAGVFNLIPYFGPLVGFALAGIVGILDANPIKAVYAIVGLLVLQQVDAWIIVPKVVGESVKLHPVIVLLAILIGGHLWGLAGMLIAVPAAAFMRLVLLRYMTELFPDGEKTLKEENRAHAAKEKAKRI